MKSITITLYDDVQFHQEPNLPNICTWDSISSTRRKKKKRSTLGTPRLSYPSSKVRCGECDAHPAMATFLALRASTVKMIRLDRAEWSYPWSTGTRPSVWSA